MSAALIKQVYYPTDTTEMRAEKLSRLNRTMDQEFAVEVVAKRYVKSRSREAENYLWGVCYPLMSDASGYEKHEIHDAMLKAYFGDDTHVVMGQTVSKPRRTTTTNEDGERDILSASDYWDFTDFVIREAALWYDLAIPPPDPEKRKR